MITVTFDIKQNKPADYLTCCLGSKTPKFSQGNLLTNLMSSKMYIGQDVIYEWLLWKLLAIQQIIFIISNLWNDRHLYNFSAIIVLENIWLAWSLLSAVVNKVAVQQIKMKLNTSSAGEGVTAEHHKPNPFVLFMSLKMPFMKQYLQKKFWAWWCSPCVFWGFFLGQCCTWM